MAESEMTLNANDWKTLLSYEDGKLFWKKRMSSRAAKGALAGTKSKTRYSRIYLKGKEYKVHRIVYMLHHGSIPDDMVIDHINRDITDNRIENLRIVSQNDNSKNQIGSGIRQLPSGRWAAAIGVDYTSNHLGTFDTQEEARNAYLIAKNKLHTIN